MMKRKIVCLVLLFIMIITIINITVQATDSTYSGARSVTQFDDIGDDTTTSETMASWLGSALVIVQVVGSGVAIIMLVVIAIKYITLCESIDSCIFSYENKKLTTELQIGDIKYRNNFAI